MDGLKEFRGQGRESKGMGGDAYNWNSEGMVGGGGVDLEFHRGQTLSVFLENAFEKANIQMGRRLTIMEF